MNGVAALDLLDRQLQALAVEFVLSVDDPIRPRQQWLAAAAIRHVRDGKAVEDRPTAGLVGPQPAADFDRHRALIGEGDLILGTRWGTHVAARVYASGFTNDGSVSPRMPASKFSAAMRAISP